MHFAAHLEMIDLLYDIKQHSKAVVSVRYSDNGQLLAIASADKTLSIVNTTTGAIEATLGEEHTCGINDCIWISENLLASGSDDQSVKVWDIVKGSVISTLKGPKTFVYSLAVNPNDRTILAGGYDGSITTYHLSGREPLLTHSGHSEPIVSIAMDSAGEHFATAAQDGLIRVWKSGAPSLCLRTIIGTEKQSHPMSCVSYSPNSQFILASSLDNTHRLFSSGLYDDSLGTGAWSKMEAVRSYTGHVNSRYSVFSALYSNVYGNYVLSGSEDNKVYLWNLDDSSIAASAEGHQGVVMAVAGNPDPNRQQIASGCADGSVRLWNVSQGTSPMEGDN